MASNLVHQKFIIFDDIFIAVEEEEMTAIECSEQEFNFKEFLAK